MTELSLFSQRLQRARKRKDLSMKQLAALAEVPYATVYRLERGLHGHPRLDVASKLARALGVSLDWLTGTFDNGDDTEQMEPAGVGTEVEA